MNRGMHESNDMFQAFVGKTVSRVEYVDDYEDGITLHFTDGSMLVVCANTSRCSLDVAASIETDDITDVRSTK